MTDRQTYRQKFGQLDRQLYRYLDSQTNERLTVRQTDIQTDTETGIQLNRQIVSQTAKHKDIQIDRHIHLDKEKDGRQKMRQIENPDSKQDPGHTASQTDR